MTRVLLMRWEHLAFLHWPVPAPVLRRLVPSALELDTFRDSAWLGVTPFRMTDVRPMFAPPIPTATDFPELNVRTYVRHAGRPGVYFLSLDATSWLAVTTARVATGLPYYHARMRQDHRDGDILYESVRSHPGAARAEFRARYRPTGDVFQSQRGSLEHWLTERYSLFVTRAQRVVRLDIEHAPWPLQPASADLQQNTMAAAAGIELPPTNPHVCFARRLDVVAHWPVLDTAPASERE